MRHLILAAMLLSASATLAQNTPDDSDDAVRDAPAIETVIVRSSRREQGLYDIPRTARVIDGEALAALVDQTTNVQEILGKAIPGFSPPVTEGSAGSLTLRGRDPLYLIDGIPVASNTNFSRFLDKFDPLTIERVEVLYGPTALYGAGAAGGVVQFFTQAPKNEPLQVELSTQVRAFMPSSNGFDSDGISPKIGASVSGRVNDWFSLVAFASYEEVNGVYRAQGNVLTGRSQFADDTTLFAKGVFDIAPEQVLTATINSTSLEPTSRFFELTGTDAGDGTIIATEAPFAFSYADPPRNEFLFGSLSYKHDALLGGQLSGLAYFSESEFLNPGSDIRAFLGRNGGPFPDAWPGLWQTGRTTDEIGFRTQFVRDIGERIDVSVGADYNDAESDSLLPISTEDGFDDSLFFDATTQSIQTPPFSLEALGIFAEFGVDVTDRFRLSGGLRWDDFEYEVIGPYDVVFTFVPGSRPGGSGSSDGTSFNIGASFQVTDQIEVFGNFSEGFTIPSLGFIGNNVAPGVPVNDSELVEPVIAESFELGVRGVVGNSDYLLTWYRSESDLSTAVGIDPATGLINRDRAPVEIQGIEASFNWRPSRRVNVLASLAWVDGEVDPNDDGNFIAQSTQDIPPLKLSIAPSLQISDRLSIFGQALYVAERDEGFQDGTDANPAESYTLFDLGMTMAVATERFGSGSFSAQIANLFNAEYVPAGEATFIPGRIYSGPGRSLSVAYRHRF